MRTLTIATLLALSITTHATPEPPTTSTLTLQLLANSYARDTTLIILDPREGTTTHTDTSDHHDGGLIQHWQTTFTYRTISSIDLPTLERGVELLYLRDNPHWMVWSNDPWVVGEDERLVRAYSFMDLSVNPLVGGGAQVGGPLGRVIDISIIADVDRGEVELVIAWANDEP